MRRLCRACAAKANQALGQKLNQVEIARIVLAGAPDSELVPKQQSRTFAALFKRHPLDFIRMLLQPPWPEFQTHTRERKCPAADHANSGNTYSNAFTDQPLANSARCFSCQSPIAPLSAPEF